jgi:hypothetical protein
MDDPNFANMDDDQFESAMSEYTPPESVEDSVESVEDEVDSLDEQEVESSTDAEIEPEEELTDDGEPEDEVEETEVEAEEEDSEETTEVTESDSSESLEDLYKPFKASGKEVSVTSVDEAMKLMKMGVDYSVKLHGFKQHKGTIKTLQTNDIDEAQLNYLIDLKNGNPQAINKLLADHKIDPMEMEVEEDSSYTPSDHSVSQSQVDLDDVIERIQSSPSFSTTSDIVTNQWDATSKQAVFKDPSILELLNEHVSNGTYERVTNEVQRVRMFGGLNGLSDLEAYDQVGKTLYEQSQKAPTKQVSTAPKHKPNTDRKRKASPSKGTTKSTKPKYDYAAMDDDAFEKLLQGN